MNKKERSQLNITLNPDNQKTIGLLRSKYGINISGCVKTFLKQYLEQLEKKHVNPNL